jgi:hypothetical protein
MQFLEHYFLEQKLDPDNSEDIEKFYNTVVYHFTPKTRTRTKVKIKSLPTDEVQKYRDKMFIKKGKESVSSNKKYYKTSSGSIKKKKEDQVGGDIDEKIYLLNFWMGIDKREDFNKFLDGELYEVTDDAMEVEKFKNDNQLVVYLKNVPVEAIISYKNKSGDWIDFEEDMKDVDKYEFIKFEENNWFLAELELYSDIMDVELDEEENKK